MEMGPKLDPEMYEVASYPQERSLPPSLLCGKQGSSSVDENLCNMKLKCVTSFEPRTGLGTLDLLKSSSNKNNQVSNRLYKANGWEVALAPGEGDNTASCTGHLDQKFNTLSKLNNNNDGQKGSTWLDLKINVKENGIAIICEGPFSARYAKNVGYFNMSKGGNVKMQLDGKTHGYVRKLSKSLCSVVSDDLKEGDHTISIQAIGNALTGFSHLIWA